MQRTATLRIFVGPRPTGPCSNFGAGNRRHPSGIPRHRARIEARPVRARRDELGNRESPRIGRADASTVESLSVWRTSASGQSRDAVALSAAHAAAIPAAAAVRRGQLCPAHVACSSGHLLRGTHAARVAIGCARGERSHPVRSTVHLVRGHRIFAGCVSARVAPVDRGVRAAVCGAADVVTAPRARGRRDAWVDRIRVESDISHGDRDRVLRVRRDVAVTCRVVVPTRRRAAGDPGMRGGGVERGADRPDRQVLEHDAGSQRRHSRCLAADSRGRWEHATASGDYGRAALARRSRSCALHMRSGD